MSSTSFAPISEYEVALAADSARVASVPVGRHASSLPAEILRKNIKWFCMLRWIVVALFVALGLVGLIPGLLAHFGLRAYRNWPFVVAGVATLANLAFLAHARRLTDPAVGSRAMANLWAQIIFDLLALTVVVHYMGSLETYVAFAYLFHIVLSCIFFSRGRSLVVTVVASVLYISCVVLEEANVVAPAGIHLDPALRDQLDRMPGLVLLSVIWAVLTWIVVWYLASDLSATVRKRDLELAESNRRLIAAQEEKARHMLRTTHELKAPFAAMNANVQLLVEGLCGELPEKAKEVLDRIAGRSRRLATEIKEMLQLANLDAVGDDTPKWAEIDLADTIRWCISQLQSVARQRGVRIEQELRPIRVSAVEDHMKMLFSNLIANAINYSNPGGKVRVTCTGGGNNDPVITVQDEGIGIAAQDLPHVFDEYYRTKEAVLHNRESSGLGLAIVRHVAEIHRIRLRVKSQLATGTTFTLQFSRAGGAFDATET